MILLDGKFEVDGRNGEIQIDLYGDTHLGSKSVDEALLKKHIKETKDSGRYWAHLGDAIDGILPGDRRFRAENIADWAWEALKGEMLIEAEWGKFRELFEPIQDRALFVLDGDGKHNVSANVANCMAATLERMAIAPGGVMTWYNFSCRRACKDVRLIPIVFHHGWFSGRLPGGKLNNLDRALAVYPEAWGFFCGHGHTKMANRVDSLRREGAHVRQWIRRAAMTGSYLRTYAENTQGYGEVKGYMPAGLGRITVVLRPFSDEDEKRIEVLNV